MIVKHRSTSQPAALSVFYRVAGKFFESMHSLCCIYSSVIIGWFQRWKTRRRQDGQLTGQPSITSSSQAIVVDIAEFRPITPIRPAHTRFSGQEKHPHGMVRVLYR